MKRFVVLTLATICIFLSSNAPAEFSVNTRDVIKSDSTGGSFCAESYETAYMTGYKKGMEDTVAEIQKNEPANTLNIINRLGDIILKETSEENLLALKKNVNEVKAQNPDLSIFRVYNVLIDDRLRELRNKDSSKDKKSKSQKSK